jgi:uncharacterized protein YqhQ
MALCNGVLMRGPGRWAAAVRLADGTIRVREGGAAPWATHARQVPIVRGCVALAESMAIGIPALLWSIAQAAPVGRAVPVRKSVVIRTAVLALALVIGIFFVLPATLAKLLAGGHGSLLFALAEASIRLAVLLAYLVGIGHLADVRRLFAYHGAEHATVGAYEAGAPLTVEAASRFGTRHVRCGTTFLLVVLVLAVVAHAAVGPASWTVLLLSRVAVVPIVIGVSYEMLRAAAGRSQRRLVRWLLAPGLALQSLTTRRPDAGQLEVALVALRTAVGAPVDTRTVDVGGIRTPAAISG